jgi:hypothetical protein
MRVPALPEVVRLVPEEYQEADAAGQPTGVAKPDAPVGVFRPVTGVEQARYVDLASRDGWNSAHAQVALDKLVTWENVHVGDQPFDPANAAHRAAIDGLWWMNCGRDLMHRLHLTEKDAGKSPLPSSSA